jgi:hypothetical protein
MQLTYIKDVNNIWLKSIKFSLKCFPKIESISLKLICPITFPSHLTFLDLLNVIIDCKVEEQLC